jgi:hypothetical protein
LTLAVCTAVVLVSAKFITALKLSFGRGYYINLGSSLVDPRQGEKSPADIAVYLD